MDGRPKCIKKFAFTSVCVYNCLRVDGALMKLYSSKLIINQDHVTEKFQNMLLGLQKIERHCSKGVAGVSGRGSSFYLAWGPFLNTNRSEFRNRARAKSFRVWGGGGERG